MVILDSAHGYEHVLEELRLYGEMVTPGSYLVVEDTQFGGRPIKPRNRPGPWEAVIDTVGDTILFLSDGGPTAGRTTDCDEILAQVREWNRVKKLTFHEAEFLPAVGVGHLLPA